MSSSLTAVPSGGGQGSVDSSAALFGRVTRVDEADADADADFAHVLRRLPPAGETAPVSGVVVQPPSSSGRGIESSSSSSSSTSKPGAAAAPSGDVTAERRDDARGDASVASVGVRAGAVAAAAGAVGALGAGTGVQAGAARNGAVGGGGGGGDAGGGSDGGSALGGVGGDGDVIGGDSSSARDGGVVLHAAAPAAVQSSGGGVHKSPTPGSDSSADASANGAAAAVATPPPAKRAGRRVRVAGAAFRVTFTDRNEFYSPVPRDDDGDAFADGVEEAKSRDVRNPHEIVFQDGLGDEDENDNEEVSMTSSSDVDDDDDDDDDADLDDESGLARTRAHEDPRVVAERRARAKARKEKRKLQLRRMRGADEDDVDLVLDDGDVGQTAAAAQGAGVGSVGSAKTPASADGGAGGKDAAPASAGAAASSTASAPLPPGAVRIKPSKLYAATIGLRAAASESGSEAGTDDDGGNDNDEDAEIRRLSDKVRIHRSSITLRGALGGEWSDVQRLMTAAIRDQDATTAAEVTTAIAEAATRASPRRADVSGTAAAAAAATSVAVAAVAASGLVSARDVTARQSARVTPQVIANVLTAGGDATQSALPPAPAPEASVALAGSRTGSADTAQPPAAGASSPAPLAPGAASAPARVTAPIVRTADEQADAWNEIERIQQREGVRGSERDESTRAIHYAEAVRALALEDLSAERHQMLVAYPPANCCAAIFASCLGPPKLRADLVPRRDLLFAVAKRAVSGTDQLGERILQTVYMRLTGNKGFAPTIGRHWESIGFQGDNPRSDLRGAGTLGPLQLLYLVQSHPELALQIYRLSQDPTQSFPFCVVSLSMTRVTLEATRDGRLNALANKVGSFDDVFNDFYVAVFFHWFKLWRQHNYVVTDFGRAIREVERTARSKSYKTLVNDLVAYTRTRRGLNVGHESRQELAFGHGESQSMSPL